MAENAPLMGRNPRLVPSKEEREAARFEQRLETLPPDEQQAFRIHQHPCQDKSYTGLVVARCCAHALGAELRNRAHVRRVAVAGDKDGFQLEVIVDSDFSHDTIQPSDLFFRGYVVYWRTEQH